MSLDKMNTDILKKNINDLVQLMNENQVDALYLSSFDPFLNEYVPLSNCLRYFVTLFTGSTAEVLMLKTGEVRLYVDGRYHEQADLESPLDIVTVIKASINDVLVDLIIEDINSLGMKNIGICENRTSLGFYEKLNHSVSHITFLKKPIVSILKPTLESNLGPINELSELDAGESISNKLERIITKSSDAYFVTALDSVAWISNSRGYHLPCMSSFLGTALVTSNRVYVFIDSKIEFKSISEQVEFIHIENEKDLKANLAKIQSQLNISSLYYDPLQINVESFELLVSTFTRNCLVESSGGLLKYHSIKSSAELEIMKDSFERADKAIFNTINWVRDSLSEGKKISERDLFNQTNLEYKKQGSLSQSFNTISGVDANGSIIHYSNPKDDVFINNNSMALLDSGGYFKSGYATDTTRTFLGAKNGIATDKHKLIYTLVLKGILHCQNAVFKKGTLGAALDLIARAPLYSYGYDYGHGTGHGVGINVHEGGVKINGVSTLPMKEGQVVSIEPGIYIPGFGGVRLENIVFVKQHPEFSDFLIFESLTNIGFDPLLINYELLTSTELDWLNSYEKICKARKRSFLSN